MTTGRVPAPSGERPPTRASADAPRWTRPILVRVLVQGVAVFLALLATQIAIFLLGDPLTNSRPLVTLLVGLAGAGLAVLVYVLVVRRTERRPIDELLPRAAGRGLLCGIAVGAVAFSVAIAVLAALGDYDVVGTGPVSSLATIVGLMAPAAVQEELVFRGVLFRLSEERLGTVGAIALSAVAFGALHLANADASLWGGASVAIGAGVMLAAAYAASRTLWLPVGIHFAWNLAESGVYGTINSGSTAQAPVSLLVSSLHGPRLWTGGAFGPEAGLPGLLVCCVVSAVLLGLAVRRRRLRPARLKGTTTPPRR